MDLVVVVGSINVDEVVRVTRRPEPGETVGGAVFERHPGGKGANQAVAAALAGVPVELIARIGDDDLGVVRRSELVALGVGTANVTSTSGKATGVAVITVTPDGENTIVVAPGANGELGVVDVEASQPILTRARVLLLQLEVPLETVARAIELAGNETVVVLNASPASSVPISLLQRVTVLVTNEHEAALLSDVSVEDAGSAATAARRLLALGPRSIVVTLGPFGAIAVSEEATVRVPAPVARVVDTTGAGDAFVGALAARLAVGADLEEAVRFGVAVGSATTEHRGALPHLPD